MQAEQIALSDGSVMDVEEKDLQMKLDQSVLQQKRSGIFYGIICCFSQLSNWSATVINYGLPAALFFHTFFDRDEATSLNAEALLVLTVYSGILQGQFRHINYHAQAISQVWSIGVRAVATFGKSFN